MPSLSYYCQKCGSGNVPGRESCKQCGTRLMIIVEPPATRYEVSYATPYEEHLLERISLLETYLGRLTDRFEKILDVMMRQAQAAYLDHTLLESLIALLDGSDVIESGDVSTVWQMRRAMDSVRREREAQRAEVKQKILAQHTAADGKQFETALDEGLQLFEDGQALAGVKKLERAVLLSPSNGALLYFLGQHFYLAKKSVLARDYLAQSLLHDPRNGLACLLLGLLCGDSGEFVQARALLGVALQLLEPNFPTYYALGRLRAAEGNWPEALAEFKKALALREQRAEPQFAVACAYYALKRFKLAARFMRKALEADEDLGEAWYRLGLLAWRAGERQEARGFFQTAAKADAKNPLYREAARQRWNAGEAPAEPPFFGLSARGKKLISSGDKSLAVFLRDETERLCWSYPPRDIESWRDLQPAKLDD